MLTEKPGGTIWITARKISSARNVLNLPHILCSTAFCMNNILLYTLSFIAYAVNIIVGSFVSYKIPFIG
jgi:hypothetical protein